MGAIRERKNKKGKTVYYAEIRRKGIPAACKSFSRLTDAKIWSQEVETSMRSGRFLPLAETQRHTLADAIKRYEIEELLKKKPKTHTEQNRQLDWFKAQIGPRTLAELSPALLNEIKGRFLREEIREGVTRKRQTWNRYLSALSCVLQMCVSEWEWMEHNPARRVRREKEAAGRVRFLSEDERLNLLEACKKNRSANLYPLVILALSTGMRKGELYHLTWDQIDISKVVIQLGQTKNGERRRVAVRGLTQELLREHGKVRRIDTNLAFPGQFTSRTG
jgi:integrase